MSDTGLSGRLKARRKEFGLTLDDVAGRAGISKTYLWELENDEEGIKRPSVDVLSRVADILAMTLPELLGTSPAPPPSPFVEMARRIEVERDAALVEIERDAALVEIDRLRAEVERLTKQTDRLTRVCRRMLAIMNELAGDVAGHYGGGEARRDAEILREAPGYDPEPGPAGDIAREFTPTEPGWYWAISRTCKVLDDRLEIVKVFMSLDDRLKAHAESHYITELDQWRFFMGPLPRPKIPEPGPAARHAGDGATEGREDR